MVSKNNKNIQIVQGLPIKFKNDKLILTKELAFSSFAVRKIKELIPYLRKGKITKTIASKNAYLMYRGVCLKKDKDLFEKNHFRYDVTIIFPYQFSDEFNKTIGHWHKTPEIYEVLSGKAIFLIQGPKSSSKKIYLKKIKAPSKIIIPAFYNHLIINPSENPLIIADIFSNQVQSDYSVLKNKHGAAYYILNSKFKNKKLNFTVVKNPRYIAAGKPQLNKWPKSPFSKLQFKKPLYSEFINNPEKFKFLNPVQR